MDLRYGTNPHQRPARAEPVRPDGWPLRVLAGEPSYVNLLDALNGWQLVREASAALGRPAASSFKHVSPAGVAVAGPIDDVIAADHRVSAVGDLTSAYLRARDADPKSSYGDFVAVSHPVDAELAELLRGLTCDGIIAPDFAPGTVRTLAAKKSGHFLVLKSDPEFVPPEFSSREVFGLRLTEPRDSYPLTAEMFADVSESAAADLLLGLIALRYTQSNSVAYVRDGAAIGIGAGQQSRVDCTRLAGEKAATWWLRRHPAVRDLELPGSMRRQDRINARLDFLAALPTADRADWLAGLDGVSFVSDGALPFRDNVDEAAQYGVRHIAEPGGSIRGADVERACAEHGITLTRTDVRLFHH